MASRIPLQDLAVEQFTAPSADARQHKRPLSPSRSSALFNPAKRRILDVEGISPSHGLATSSSLAFRPTSSTVYGSHVATPSRSCRKPDTRASVVLPSSSGSTKTCINSHTPHLRPDEANTILLASPISLDPRTPPSIHLHHATRNVDRQSKHYPGFEIYHDGPTGVGLPISTVPLQDHGGSVGVNLDDAEGIKENVPPRRKTKKLCSKGVSSATPIHPTSSSPFIFARKNDASCPAGAPSSCLTWG